MARHWHSGANNETITSGIKRKYNKYNGVAVILAVLPGVRFGQSLIADEIGDSLATPMDGYLFSSDWQWHSSPQFSIWQGFDHEWQRFSAQTRDKKLQTLKRVTQRFFNADADLTLSADDSFSFTVKSCHSATYSRQLNVAPLGALFCDADRQYFEQYQPDVVFFRSTTLASNNRACDFCFRWRERTHKDAPNENL